MATVLDCMLVTCQGCNRRVKSRQRVGYRWLCVDCRKAAAPDYKPCRHCGERQAQPERRRLCTTCHKDAAIREQYATVLPGEKAKPRSDRPRECRHCGSPSTGRARGLCWRCYEVADIRAQYQPVSKFANRFRADPREREGYVAPLPEPVRGEIDFESWLGVLERRAERGELLFHPEDRR